MVFCKHKTPDWLIILFLETDKQILLNKRTNERGKEQTNYRASERERERGERTNERFFSLFEYASQ